MMKFGHLQLVCLIAMTHAVDVRAEGIDWIWTHHASGMVTANVFEGGPPVFDIAPESGNGLVNIFGIFAVLDAFAT